MLLTMDQFIKLWFKYVIYDVNELYLKKKYVCFHIQSL